MKHPIYEEALVAETADDKAWTHKPVGNAPTLSVTGGPINAFGKQLVLSSLTYSDGKVFRRELGQVGDRPLEARTLAFRLSPLLGADYDQAFRRVSELAEGREIRPEDRDLLTAAAVWRETLAAALYDLAAPTPSALHVLTSAADIDDYLQTHRPVTFRPAHLPEPVEIGAVGEKTLLHGATGTGKTFVTLYLAVRLAEAGIRTAFLLTEGGRYAAARLKTAWRKHAELPFPLIVVPFTTGHLDPERIGKIRRQLDETGTEAVTLDVLSPLLTDENSAGEYNTIRKLLSPLTEDRFYLEVHHHNKTGTPRGSGRILDDAAYDLKVSKSKNTGFPKLQPGDKSRGGTRTDWAVVLDIGTGYPKETAPSANEETRQPKQTAKNQENRIIYDTIQTLKKTLNRPVAVVEIHVALDDLVTRQTLQRRLNEMVKAGQITERINAVKEPGRRPRTGYE